MAESKQEIKKQISEIEKAMQAPDFWSDKNKAQEKVKELNELKAKLAGLNKYDKGNAIVTIISGAGGMDSEDFARILYEMYVKYADGCGWQVFLIHEHHNDHDGYKNISFEISGAGVYGKLKNENGVHRLVRISPFNANKKRHTSFALVEVLPKFGKLEASDISIPEADLKIEFSKSSGPGGQNVNKRETAVRVVHTPTGISAHASGERSQEANRERAMAIMRAKIFKLAQKSKRNIEEAMKLSSGTEIEWGNQVRSYVLHPYKMVKDHRTKVETNQVEDVLAGDLEEFIEGARVLW